MADPHKSEAPQAFLLVATGKPVPEDFCEQVEQLVADMRSGVVTSFAFAAIGPDFASCNNAYMRGRCDRLNLLGQLTLLQHGITKAELDAE